MAIGSDFFQKILSVFGFRLKRFIVENRHQTRYRHKFLLSDNR